MQLTFEDKNRAYERSQDDIFQSQIERQEHEDWLDEQEELSRREHLEKKVGDYGKNSNSGLL